MLIVIAAAPGIGRPLDQTGTARVIAETLLSIGGQSCWVALAVLDGLATFFTEIITDNRTVALPLPTVMATADKLDSLVETPFSAEAPPLAATASAID